MKTDTMLTTHDATTIGENMRGNDALILQAQRAEIISRETFTRGGDLGKIIKARIKRLDDSRVFLVKPLNDHVKDINAEVRRATQPMTEALEILRVKMTAWGVEEQARKDEEERKRRSDEDAKALAQAEADEKAAKDAAAEADDARARADDARLHGDDSAVLAADKEASDADAASIVHQQAADETLNKAADRPVADTRVQKVRGNYGSVSSIKKVWKVRVVDLTALPKEYIAAIMASEAVAAAVRLAIKPLTAKAIEDEKTDVPGLRIFQDDQLQIR